VLETRLEILPRELTVMPLGEPQGILARQPSTADVEAGEVGRPPEAVLEEFEIVVDTRLAVVQILVVDERALHSRVEGLEAVGLSVQGVLIAVPREVAA